MTLWRPPGQLRLEPPPFRLEELEERVVDALELHREPRLERVLHVVRTSLMPEVPLCPYSQERFVA